MAKLKIESGDWVVVCDGRKSLILKNVGTTASPSLRTAEVREHDDPRTRELGNDAPGRVHSSLGEVRSNVEQTDWHREAEQAFLEGLARRLDAAITKGETKHLIIVAPPRALATIRVACTPPVRKAIRAEVEKDYVKLPVPEIESRLTE
jgi:protein required for attachment to host cells